MKASKFKLNKVLVVSAKFFGFKHMGGHFFKKGDKELDLTASGSSRQDVAYHIAKKFA